MENKTFKTANELLLSEISQEEIEFVLSFLKDAPKDYAELREKSGLSDIKVNRALEYLRNNLYIKYTMNSDGKWELK
jgi:hypothetical protein